MSEMSCLSAVLLVVLAGVGLHSCYRAEARAVARLAGEIEGLRVLDVDGVEDVTLENIWLDCEYRGVPLYFMNVTAESFREVRHLEVAQVGEVCFDVTGYLMEGDSAGEPCAWGSALDFGPDGDVGRRFDPPITSIPEFLARLDEVLAVVNFLPNSGPGERIGEERFGDRRVENRVVRRP